MFKVDLLQDVIRDLGVERVLPKAQDKVLYWAACWQRENLIYRGVPDRLYNYNYGQGVEGGQLHPPVQLVVEGGSQVGGHGGDVHLPLGEGGHRGICRGYGKLAYEFDESYGAKFCTFIFHR